MASLEEARRQCEARADCYVISVDAKQTSTLFGGTPAGRLGLFNLTQAMGSNPGISIYVRMPNEDTAVQCLVSAAAADLVAPNVSPPNDDTFYTDAAAPTEDGVELAAPLAVLARGPAPKGVEVLAGSNLDEGTMFMDECPLISCNASDVEFEAWAVKMYGAELGRKVPAAYRSVESPTPKCRGRTGDVGTSGAWLAAMRSAGDNAILCRTRELLHAVWRQGSPAWWYYFTATPLFSVNEAPGQMPYMGAFHGAEVPFVFGDAFELRSDGERGLSRAMGCYWVNFAATGDPNKGPSKCVTALSLPTWPAFGEDTKAIIFSNTTIDIRRGLKKEQCDLFAQYSRTGTSEILTV